MNLLGSLPAQLSGLLKKPDTILLLVLIVMLLKNKDNLFLVLALGYIALM